MNPSIVKIAMAVSLGYLLFKPKDNEGGESFLDSTDPNLTIPIKSNNPGFIATMVSTPQNVVLARYNTIAAGTAALIRVLQQALSSGNNTISKIVAGYPYPMRSYEQNDFAQDIDNYVGFGINQPLTADKATIKLLAEAIVFSAAGNSWILTDQRFESGWKLV